MMKPIFKNRPNPVHNVKGKEVWESRSAASVVVIFGLYKEDMYVLIEQRSSSIASQPNKWVVPGGYMDWDESGWECAVRETYEETSFNINHYSKEMIYDGNKEPFYVKTEPDEHRQNIALNYCMVFNFDKIGLPRDIESYTDSEVQKVKWEKIENIHKYNWAFDHEKRIRMALNKVAKYEREKK